MPKHLQIIIDGQDEGDLEIAIAEVTRLIRDGFTTGMDRNETGQFTFTLTEGRA